MIESKESIGNINSCLGKQDKNIFMKKFVKKIVIYLKFFSRCHL